MRYIIGIDLGTTNCAVAFIDTEQPAMPLQTFAIPQLSAAGKIDSLHTLPSFCYLAGNREWPPGSLKLPWKEETATFVGQFAKIQGAKVPTRLVHSAKSWLCHSASNRRDRILPLEAADVTQRMSPVEASSKYLMHIRDAWNATMAKGQPSFELEEQEVILTVPASFDEVARTLTVEAAREAGFLHLTLVEEPQAAFYSWISQHEKKWQAQFKEGDSILVCDVGGGTTDFSLIEIRKEGENLFFQRMAVGDHLLLGGDNMDLFLAHAIEQKLQQKEQVSVDPSQWTQLLAEARNAKEMLLSSEIIQKEGYPVVLQGVGSSVIKGSVAITISRQEIEELLGQGFFSYYPLEEALQLHRSRGIRTMGLPYEDEPSITKHLAHFLQQAHFLDKGRGIDYILFNGGAFKAKIFQNAIEKALQSWFPQTFLQTLTPHSLDLAVARGAAYFGKVRRGEGIAIKGGLPRTYYLKVDIKSPLGEIKSQALTLLPRGSEEGKKFQPEQIFFLRPNIPVAFHLITSHVRLEDHEGYLIDIDPLEMQLLSPIQTILRFGRKQASSEVETLIPVRLGIQLTEIGTIEMWLESQKTDHKWLLEFQIRSATGQDSSLLHFATKGATGETYEKGYLEDAKQLIEELFQSNGGIKPSQIMEKLEACIGESKLTWGSSLLRELWGSLLKISSQRKLSLEHEARWWNLAGFFLRPGFGFPLDDFKIKELWKVVLADFKKMKNPEILIQMWICFRRIAGGLNKGQQMQVASELMAALFDKKSGKIDLKKKGDFYLYSEKIRALAAFERLDTTTKIRLGDLIVDRILHHSPANCDYWALGRIGARHLLYGSAGQVVPREDCTQWIEKLLHHHPLLENHEDYLFMLAQLAKKTTHRELNLPDSVIQNILAIHPYDELKKLLLEEHKLTQKEQEQIYGDQLPAGLILSSSE